MKKSIKKTNRTILSIYILLCFITVLNANIVSSSAATCEHDSVGVKIEYIDEYVNSTFHNSYDKYTYFCNDCGVIVHIDTAYQQLEDHSLDTRDSGHHGGKHSWSHYCTRCSFVDTITVVCPGPPCNAPFSLLLDK